MRFSGVFTALDFFRVGELNPGELAFNCSYALYFFPMSMYLDLVSTNSRVLIAPPITGGEYLKVTLSSSKK
jgi:hypothetical protein